ncbi:hypothetical protein N5D52_20855 [Pseudomonas sp. GD03860]|uniref:hypothetical protein n=1 Tax=Pseudomonas TaxID=286 RepID=UPI00236385FB|nr:MULTISPECIES: hypothetical protein [Pseudomonas]MDD2059039.1 hypothetical protein [Pseudomonas putida]MDH0639384.1 hypothetical protein [Pseudomonas sp. GD03860]
MTVYAVTAARYDEDRRLVALQGQETHGYVANTLPGSAAPRKFDVQEVLCLIDGGDSFILTFGPFDKRLSGGQIVPDGRGSLVEEQGEAGKRISDLPSF